MTELKARVSGLKTFCTARYLRKSASRGFGWLSILKDVYSKQCRLLARMRHNKIAAGLPLSGEEPSCKGLSGMTESGPDPDIVECRPPFHHFRSRGEIRPE
jgi:hypothetical protein